MITMRDIAVRAGVSRSTVSFVLNGKHAEMGVNENTRQLVLKTADEMGYRRNELARAVVTGRMPAFAFLTLRYALESEVVARILNGVLDEAETCGYTVQVMRFATENDEDLVRRCIELRPAGILGIYVPSSLLSILQQETERFHIPVVVLDSTPPIEGGTHILSDDEDGCRQAINHLASLGHRRIAMIAGLPHSVASNLRLQGYRAAMSALGYPILPGYEEIGHWLPGPIEEATHRLFSLPVPPTAVFCADDKTALVACRVLRSLGCHVPEDVSLVGFANLGMASFSDPPLTTVAQPFAAMGRSAVLRLLAPPSEEPGPPNREGISFYRERLPTNLIVRNSTGPIRLA